MLDYRSIMNGSRKDFPASLIRAGLAAASIGYRAAVSLRNRRFDRGSGIQQAGVPVISVGNITAGGTGKTPLVAAIAHHLRERSLRVALISRGYGSDQTGVNDEALELYDRLPDVPHIQNPDRFEACRIAVEELDMQVIVLDDGFQHRQLHRDLDIAVIDATCPFGYDHLLPRGLLREPVQNLARAKIILLSRADLLDQTSKAALLDHLQKLAPTAIVAQCSHSPTRLMGHEQHHSLDLLRNRSVAAFAGIGNPQPFFKSLEDLGGNVVSSQSLADHCGYDRQIVAKLTQWLDQLKPLHPDLMAICTRKDLVKLRARQLGGVPLWAVEIEIEIGAGKKAFWQAINDLVEPLTNIASDSTSPTAPR